jgi:hypothetical protein
MTKQEIAEKMFAKHPKLSGVYVSDDNNCFAIEKDVKSHCKKKREIKYEYISRKKTNASKKEVEPTNNQ